MEDQTHQPLPNYNGERPLFAAIRSGWRPAANRQLVELDLHINDADFAAALVDNFRPLSAFRFSDRIKDIPAHRWLSSKLGPYPPRSRVITRQ